MNPYSTVQLNTFMDTTVTLALNGVSQGCIDRTVAASSQPQAGFQMIISHGGMVFGHNNLRGKRLTHINKWSRIMQSRR